VKLSLCFRTISVAKRSVAVVPIAIGIVSKPENCHECRNLIASSERIWVQLSFLFCLGSMNLLAKTVTTLPAEALAKAGQLTFIVRVS
jgi:hypothetical protein